MSLLGALARGGLRLAGWRPLDLAARPRRAVVIGYPHTSNWDFVLGILAMFALEIRPRWIGKDSLFRAPFGGLMRLIGGIPVNRRAPSGFVAKMAEAFVGREDFLLCIAPEGTRSRTEGWKSGFHRIALAAQVPILIATIDYARREIGLIGRVEPSTNIAGDMEQIASLFVGRRGHIPENAAPIRLLP